MKFELKANDRLILARVLELKLHHRVGHPFRQGGSLLYSHFMSSAKGCWGERWRQVHSSWSKAAFAWLKAIFWRRGNSYEPWVANTHSSWGSEWSTNSIHSVSFSVIMLIAQATGLMEELLLYSHTPLLLSTKTYGAGKHMKMVYTVK